MVMHTLTVFHISKYCREADRVLSFLKKVPWLALDLPTSSLMSASFSAKITFGYSRLRAFLSHRSKVVSSCHQIFLSF